MSVDVERIRRACVRKKKMGLVGCVLTVDQVLELIVRGDARQMQYQLRVEMLENEIGAMQARAMCAHPEVADLDGGMVTLDEAVEATGMHRTTIARLVLKGVVRGKKLPGLTTDGRLFPMVHVDLEQLRAYAALDRHERRLVVKGKRRLVVSL